MEKPDSNLETLPQTGAQIEQEVTPPSVEELRALVKRWHQTARCMIRSHDGETEEWPRAALFFGFKCYFNCYRELEALIGREADSQPHQSSRKIHHAQNRPRAH